MTIDFGFPNFGLQVAKLEISNLELFIFQKIWTIGFKTKFSKFDDISDLFKKNIWRSASFKRNRDSTYIM